MTGETLAENLKSVKPLSFDQAIISPMDKPFSPPGHHIIVLKVIGNMYLSLANARIHSYVRAIYHPVVL